MNMNRYANGKIYRLVNNVDDQFYVGSTCMPLAKRKSDHKSRAKQRPDSHVYKHLNTVGWDNVKIILIEEYKCENKMELEKRERYWIEELEAPLNTNIPTRGTRCDHNRQRAHCRECDGSAFCEHDRRRYQCRECDGSSFCEHDRQRSKCKDCDGSQICSHDKQRYQCRDCSGSSFCEHGKRRSACRECGGAGAQKITCKCGAIIRKSNLPQHRRTARHIHAFIHS